MHQIQLDDQLFQEAQRRAAEAGFVSVDEYIADVLKQDFQDEDLDHFFTPERLAHIDGAAAQIEAGNFFTAEEAATELAKRRTEWLRQNPIQP